MADVKSGDTLLVGAECSVQFAGDRALRFRVIRVLDWPTYDGWVWLDGYQLDPEGDAVARRSIFVQQDGLVVEQRTGAAGTGVSGAGRGGSAR